ncbi:MAG TPA: winged helix-turn-helix domain-containing protein [Candidatus Limnocylindrales bacterium]|nr:winged helix-turn-helix domain-containing protein [Candidatus Limnocylindrales bacterium]
MDRRPATPEEARALANPLRLRILRLCLDRALTNEELAARLGKDAGTVLHHVRLLVKTGFLAPVEERRGPRGSVERPYTATGKSWTLDVGEAEAGSDRASASALALIDAFRAEVAEVPGAWVTETVRMGVRLTPADFERLGERMKELVEEIIAADDPDGTPYGLFIGMHRQPE